MKLTIGNYSIGVNDAEKEPENDFKVKAQFLSGEVGIAKVEGKYRHGEWSLKTVFTQTEASIEASKEKAEAGLYGKIALAEGGGKIYVPIIFTSHKLDIGLEVGLGSFGGGYSIDTKEKKLNLEDI